MSKTKNTDTEKQILEAAKRIFQTKGMDGARMQEIANEAKINKAMLHYYYRSKQLLFEAVFKTAFSLLAPQINKILNDDSSVEDKIRNFTSSYISFVIKHPYLPNFVIQELNKNPEFLNKLKERKNFPDISKFKQQVDDEVKAGILIPISGEQLFVNIISLNIFPFIAKNLVKGLIGKDETSFENLMNERKTLVAEFIIQSIKRTP